MNERSEKFAAVAVPSPNQRPPNYRVAILEEEVQKMRNKSGAKNNYRGGGQRKEKEGESTEPEGVNVVKKLAYLKNRYDWVSIHNRTTTLSTAVPYRSNEMWLILFFMNAY